MDDSTSERWLPVVGAEGYYEVSDLGRVRSLPRQTVRGIRGGRILKPARLPAGYLWVAISVGGKAPHRYIHVLVAQAFIGPCPEGQQVRHRDGDPGNCAVSNLVYGTDSENKLDMRDHGTHYWGGRDRCGSGHLYTEANTILRHWPDGRFKQRVCRICLAMWTANARAKRRMADI